MGSLASVSLGQIVTALGRYRPVLLTIAAIALIANVVPRDDQLGAAGAPGASTPTTAVRSGFGPGTGTAEDDPGATESALPATPFVDGAAPVVDVGGGAFDLGGDSGSSSGDFAFGGDTSGTGSGSSSGDFGTDFGSGSTSTTTANVPLAIRASTWASRTAGTPLAEQGVPEGTLPVGKRLGQDDKLSFIRLSGTDTTLTLISDPAGARLGDSAAVVLCPVTTASWSSGEAIAFSAAPAYECAASIMPQRNGESWSFDLTNFPDRASDKGWAIVPAVGAPVDFQVTFKKA